MEKRILFVDDDLNVLHGFKRTLRPLRDEWDMAFVSNGIRALELLDQRAFDVVVTDLRMPGMHGLELLDRIMKHHSHIVRIVLSGESDRNWVMRSTRVCHQFLPKPCDADVLKAVIKRTSTIFGLLRDDAIKRVISRMDSLPSLPMFYREMMDLLRSPGASLGDVGKVISRDVSMTAKILQLVNSAFFGFSRHISDPGQATVLLGLDIIRSLVLSIRIFSQFDTTKTGKVFLKGLWEHSVTTGQFSKIVAEDESQEKVVVDHAFMAGLLHDTGKLVLFSNFPEKYGKALSLSRDENFPLWESEREIFGVSHGEVGAYLLGLWGLPIPIIEAIAFHHNPTRCMEKNFTPLTAVHVANACDKDDGTKDEDYISLQVDNDYLAELNFEHRMPWWIKICRGGISRGVGNES
ncbi:MAG: response regulator [Pseudomonadota bacterium]